MSHSCTRLDVTRPDEPAESLLRIHAFRPLLFGNLPVELVELVIRLAAEDNAVDDKPWLTQLARTCKAFRKVVTPILYASVVVTARNCIGIAAACARVDPPHGKSPFRLTRALFVEYSVSEFALRSFWRAFAHVEHFGGSYADYKALASEAAFRPAITILAPRLCVLPEDLRLDGIRAPVLARITHFHVTVDFKGAWAPVFARACATQNMVRVTHVIVDAPDGSALVPLAKIFLTNVPTLERILLRTSDTVAALPSIEAHVRTTGEHRVWFEKLDMDPMVDFSAKTCSFDRTRWLSGSRVLPTSAA